MARVGFTNAQGRVDFPLVAGGVCSGGVPVNADGVMLRSPPAVASFDQNADLRVTPADLNDVIAKRGTTDLTADFDGDSVVTEHDVDLAREHLGHQAAGVLDAGDREASRLRVSAAPNPARGPVEFSIGVPERGRVSLAVFDLSGRRVATVLDQPLELGLHHTRWSGRDSHGAFVPAGLYFYRLTQGRISRAALMVVAR